MSSAYGKTVGGKLQLKGGLSLKPTKKHKHKKKSKDRDTKKRERDEPLSKPFELVKVRGSGRLLSSGTTLMGQVGTKFLQELHAGDAIVIQHPTSLVEETRIVRMVLSDVSASISSAFSSDLVSSTPFYYIAAPPEDDCKQEEEEEDKKKKKRKMDEKTAFGTYAGGTEKGGQYTYRVKKSGAYGGYAIVKEVRRGKIEKGVTQSLTKFYLLTFVQDANVERSREDLLDIRAKKKGDRHCM
ncbi:hypothetical protein P3T76_001368 [Phytophthora citrophthora]|uniref:Uncharacterized protein n=1 Tax=Phytophthora citrophthora TaxID=4793 RepID=A0AAD9H086_9STRA|nr:hypothetical protein P3T76_001368 [Phytophthora citrophthora]